MNLQANFYKSVDKAPNLAVEQLNIVGDSVTDSSMYRPTYNIIRDMLSGGQTLGQVVSSPQLFFDSDKGYDTSILDSITPEEVALRSKVSDPAEKLAIAQAAKDRITQQAHEQIKAANKKKQKEALDKVLNSIDSESVDKKQEITSPQGSNN